VIKKFNPSENIIVNLEERKTKTLENGK